MKNNLRMKKHLNIILIAFMTINLTSCTVYSSMNSNKWLEYELPPSRIVRNGEPFFGGKLSDGNSFHVFEDWQISEDGRYYYNMLMQNFGWTLNDGTWIGNGNSRDKKRGAIYINPKKRVSVYFWPSGDYSAFKVGITNPSVSSKY
jgi:hypothetical protein